MNTDPKPTPAKPELSPDEPFIPLSEPTLGGNEWKYVKECLDSGWVSSVGSFVGRFERKLAQYVGASHAVAVSNGTAALHVGLRILGVEADDEVIVPSLTFIAAANAISYCGAHPVFMDVDPESWQIDDRKLEEFLETCCEVTDGACRNRQTGRRVRAVLPVHILGLACRIDRILDLTRAHHLEVLEDAAEAVGVRYRGRHVGTYGHVGAFSFNGNKVMTTGGGGMIVTDDARLAERARYLTTQARDNPGEYIHNEIGFNYRLTNIQAAMGVAQLEQLDNFLERKRQIASAYRAGLADLTGIGLMPEVEGCESAYWLYTILLPEGTTLEQRRAAIERLNRSGVGARSLWHPVHSLPPYAHCQAYRVEMAVDLYKRGICLPSSSGMTDAMIERSVALCRRHLL